MIKRVNYRAKIGIFGIRHHQTKKYGRLSFYNKRNGYDHSQIFVDCFDWITLSTRRLPLKMVSTS